VNKKLKREKHREHYILDLASDGNGGPRVIEFVIIDAWAMLWIDARSLNTHTQIHGVPEKYKTCTL